MLQQQEGTAEALAEAKPLFEEVIEGHTSHYGRSHPSTLVRVGNYADVLRLQGTSEGLAEAQALLREVVAGLEARFPASHAMVAWAKGGCEGEVFW